MTDLQEQIERAVAAADLGLPMARKGGRNPKFPYVPVVKHGEQTAQVLGLAYATHGEAVAAAVRYIAQQRRSLARHLAEPRYRALREQYGLQREIAR